MPWKTTDDYQSRLTFVMEWIALGAARGRAALCRRHGISRKCGYAWWRKYHNGGRSALKLRRRVTHAALRLQLRWLRRVRDLRLLRPSAGPKKLRWRLRRDYPRQRVPSVRTLGRWLAEAAMVRRTKRRARPGPPVRLPGRLRARCANDVWTIDFKGHFRTGNGTRINAFTVRDLASRYILCVRHFSRANETNVARIMRGMFRRFGLPRAIRMDNGGPFGAIGPRGLTGLSISWLKLGIRPEYGRPASPQDNPHHEQMHRVLQSETAKPPAHTAAGQQRRMNAWVREYNQERPHESLGMRTPTQRYRRSQRAMPAQLPEWKYPAHWQQLRIDAKGQCRWRKRPRFIGRAFAHENLGAKTLSRDTLAIYLGPHLLGELHANDPAGLRPVRWRKSNKTGRKREGLRPSLHPPRSF
jgi:putative transposase